MTNAKEGNLFFARGRGPRYRQMSAQGTPLSARITHHASLLSAVLASLVLSACSTTPRTPSAPLLTPEQPRLQDVFQVHLFGVRAAPAEHDAAPFPAAGFVLRDGEIAPVGHIATLAGTRFSHAEFSDWLAHLAERETLTVFADPVFMVGPGRAGAVSNSREVRYLSNVIFDREGNTRTVYSALSVGTRVELLTAPADAPDRMLCRVELTSLAGETEWTTAAEKPASSAGGARQPIKLQLPRESAHRVTAEAAVAFGESVILAHRARQYRLDGRGARAIEHVFCVISALLKSDGPREVPPPPVGPDLFRISLLWCDARAGANLPDDAAPADALARMGQQEDCDALLLGLTLPSGRAGNFEVTRSRAYLGPPPRVPAYAAGRPVAFDIRRATEGVAFAPSLLQNEDGIRARIAGRLGGRCELNDRRATLPSLRDQTGHAQEEYRYSEPAQEAAVFDLDLPLSPWEPKRLDLNWESAGLPDAGGPGKVHRAWVVVMPCSPEAAGPLP